MKLTKHVKGGFVINGTDFPVHLQVAYGRHVWRLLHGYRYKKMLWLRDLPVSLNDLAALGYSEAVSAYHKECDRISMKYEDRWC